MPGQRRWINVEALVSALTEKKVALGISWREAARQAGVSAPIFSRLREGKQPAVNTFLALVHWLDMPAETFLTEPNRQDLPEPLRALMSGKRRKKLSPKAKSTLDELIRLIYKLVTILHGGERAARRRRRTG